MFAQRRDGAELLQNQCPFKAKDNALNLRGLALIASFAAGDLV